LARLRPGVWAVDQLLESLLGSGRQPDVAGVWPCVYLGERVVAPTRKERKELGVEGDHALGEMEPLRERPSRYKQFLRDRAAVGV
jgi:hypothetical protein